MSNYSKNYSSYLGSKRCCNLNTQGPAGPQGPTGFGGLGPRGYTGPPGESFTGPTGRGCRGPTGPSGGPIGPTGPTGPNLWDIGSFTIEKSSGSTGISGIGYTGNVLIYGDLNVTGVIDPTSIIIGGTGPNSMVLDSENNTFRIIGNTGGMIYSGLNTSFQYISFLPRVLAALDLPPDPSNATVLYVNNTILFEDSSGSAIIGLDNSGNLLIDPSNSLIFNGNLDMSKNIIQDVSGIIFSRNINLTQNVDASFNSIAIGYNAGLDPSLNILNSICIGRDAGRNQTKPPLPIFQFDPAGIAIGTQAGFTGQIDGAIAIGSFAGTTNQGYKAIAIGFNAGGADASGNGQKERGIAIGSQAGQQNQGSFSIALGVDCGRFDSSGNAIAIGFTAARNNQGGNAIAIGNEAGRTGQGENAIAIGQFAGRTNQAANSIVISARGAAVTGAISSATYIAPIRNSYNNQLLEYNTSTNEITYQPNYFDVSGNLDLSCNTIQDVSGIYFCDGTYIGSGASFDISANQVLVLSGKQDPSGSYAGSSIVSKDRIYQQLNADPSWNSVNNYYGLAKDAYPALNPSSSGVQAVSTWTSRTFPSINTQNFRSICWSPQLKLFVAVSGTGNFNQDKIATSPDGINWTLSSSTYFAMRSVCWSAELGLFVAVGSNGAGNTNVAPYNTTTNAVITSPDGINWTFRTSAGLITSSFLWLSVCWSAELGLFVAVAYTDFDSTTTNRVMTSTDGITWTLQTSPNNTWYSVCWSAELGLFVAVSEDFNIMTSSNGINWTLRTAPVSNSWGSVCWSAELGLFVAVGRSGTINDNLITSPDGINWTSRTSANNNVWFGVCWSAELGLFVAVSANGAGNRVMTSPNGINWTSRTSSQSFNSVCWSPELGIFGGSGFQEVAISSLAGRPPTSYNVFDSSFNNIDSSGNWTLKSKSIFSDGNIVIDPSNTLFIAGNLDMSLNNIQNVNSLEIDNGTNNALLNIDGSGNLLIDPSLNLVVGSGSSLTLQPTNNLSTTLVPYGLSLNSPSIKTYPTTASFFSYPAYYTNLELGTSQDVSANGFNNVYGDYRNYTKSAGTTSDIERLNFTGFLQGFSWNDANTCKQYVSFSDNFNYNGKDANNRTSSAFNVNSISLTCPSFSTQTIANITARDALRISATNANSTYTINNSTAPSLLITGSATNVIVDISNHSFFSNATGWNCNLTGAGSSATIRNMFGLRLNPPSSSTGLTITNNWGVYSGWSSAKNYFAGGVGIGTTTINNALDISGNATISTSLRVPQITNTDNITIDPSNTLIVLGNMDVSGGYFSRGVPVTKTGDFTVQTNENWIICNGSGTITVTLPTSSSFPGRELMFKNIAAQLVNSSASNVVPLVGGAASTAILPGSAGSTATLVSDGTNWIIMQ